VVEYYTAQVPLCAQKNQVELTINTLNLTNERTNSKKCQESSLEKWVH